jgi:peptide/nickel transport system substrate-binding protein
MATQDEHPYMTNLRAELRHGRIGRREFLRTATLLGATAGAAYAMAGLPGEPHKFSWGL